MTIFGAASAPMAKVVTPDGAAPFINPSAHFCLPLIKQETLRHLPLLKAHPVTAAWAFSLPPLESNTVIPQHPKAATTNLCINCQHHLDDGTNKFSDRCHRPENPINPVNGQIIGTSCENERFSSHGASCGPTGKHFEPKSAQNPATDFDNWMAGKKFQIEESPGHGSNQC